MKLTIKEITLVAMFTGLTSMGAFLSIPIGEVPITLQSMFVILSGLILGPKLGALSQITYMILGLVGVPIFAGFTGGLHSIVKPSFGFIIGFIFSAYIVGKISHINGFCPIKIWIAAFIGTITPYLFGLPYMYYVLNIHMESGLSFMKIIQIGFLIFVPGDLVKFVITSFVAIKALPIINKSPTVL